MKEYPAALHRCLRNSIVDATRATQAELNRQILGRYEISRSNLKAAATVRIVTPKQEGNDERGGLIVTGKRLPVAKFSVIPAEPVSQVGLPVNRRQILSTVVVKGSSVVGKPNRFVLKPASGHVGVFNRRAGSRSLPVDQEYRISVPEMIRSHHIRPQLGFKMETVFRDRLYKNVQREIKELHEK